MSNKDLADMMQTNFILMHKMGDRGYNIHTFDDCMPWEKEVYLTMLENQLEKEAMEKTNGN